MLHIPLQPFIIVTSTKSNLVISTINSLAQNTLAATRYTFCHSCFPVSRLQKYRLSSSATKVSSLENIFLGLLFCMHLQPIEVDRRQIVVTYRGTTLKVCLSKEITGLIALLTQPTAQLPVSGSSPGTQKVRRRTLIPRPSSQRRIVRCTSQSTPSRLNSHCRHPQEPT